MGFFDRFTKKQTPSVQKLFDGIQSQMMILPPDMDTQAYLNLYGEVGYIFACINTRANAVADTSWYAEDLKGNKKEKSMALELLKKPNPFMSQYELFSMTSKYLDTVGQAYWYIARDGKYGLPREIWCINPQYIYIVPDKNNYIKGYVYKCGADQIPLDCDDILMFSVSNPANPYSGVSPLKALASVVETEKFSNEYNRNFFYNNATPNGIISYEKQLSDVQFERLKEQWNSQYGGLSNAHKMAILEGNAKYQTTGMSQKDMDFAVMKGINKKEILAVFSTPEILITGEAVNRGTAEVQEAIFYKNAIKPLLRLISDKLNNEFIPLFKIETDTVIKYVEVLSQDKEFIKSVLDSQVNKTICVNEGRQILSKLLGIELEDVEGGDEIMTSPMMMPLSMATDYATTGAVLASEIDNVSRETSEDDKKESTEEAKGSACGAPTENVKKADSNTDTGKKKDYFKSVNKHIKANAGVYQNAILKASVKIEKEFAKDLNSFFSKQVEDIAKQIHDGQNVNMADYDDKLKNIARKHINAGVKAGGSESARQTKSFLQAVNKDAETGIIYNHANELVSAVIDKRCNLITRINATTMSFVQKVIEEVYRDNTKLTIAEIVKRLYETGGFTKARAKTIAQTETLGAVNEGSYMMMKQNDDVIEKKAWCTNTDELVRDAHVDAGFTYSLDNPIPIDDDFIVWGERAKHPLDTSMSAKNIVNCRCCMIPIIKE